MYDDSPHQSVPLGEDSRYDPQDMLGIFGNRRKSGETLRCAQVSPDFRAISKNPKPTWGSHTITIIRRGGAIVVV